jgi:hypothetical protein
MVKPFDEPYAEWLYFLQLCQQNSTGSLQFDFASFEAGTNPSITHMDGMGAQTETQDFGKPLISGCLETKLAGGASRW